MQRRFSRSAVLVEEFPEQTEPSPTPEERRSPRSTCGSANQLLARLPIRMREVLLLRAGGLSADLIGEQLGMSANAVRVSPAPGRRPSSALTDRGVRASTASSFDELPVRRVGGLTGLRLAAALLPRRSGWGASD